MIDKIEITELKLSEYAYAGRVEKEYLEFLKEKEYSQPFVIDLLNDKEHPVRINLEKMKK